MFPSLIYSRLLHYTSFGDAWLRIIGVNFSVNISGQKVYGAGSLFDLHPRRESTIRRRKIELIPQYAQIVVGDGESQPCSFVTP